MEGRDRARDRTTKENFYYACIYDIIRETSHPRDKMLKLQHLKAKIIRLHTVKCTSMRIDIHDTTEYQGEKISLYQLIQRRQRRRGRLITELLDEAGNLQTPSRAIIGVIGEHMLRRYTSLHVEREFIDQLRTIGMTREAEI